MSKINLRKQTSASVSNPGTGQLSVFFDNSGLMTSKDEFGAVITYGTLSGFNAQIDAEIDSKKGIANGLASLGADSKIPAIQLPPSAVTTVNGYAGTVVLTKADIGLSLADNVSDANKPVSTAQATANSGVQAYAIQRANQTGTQLASTVSNFATTASAAAPVQSVSGRAGAIVLTSSDIGLTNVVNLDTSTTANITDSLNKRLVTDAQRTSLAIIGSYTNVTSATIVNVPLNSSPAVLSLMTLTPGAGTHKVTFNGQYSATATSMTAQAAADLTSTYNYLQGLTATGSHILVFGAETITPGVYTVGGAGSITTATTVVLDAQGNSNAVFVFKISGAFSTGASAVVTLANGAQASNVFWVVQGAITLGASTTFIGTLISVVAVSSAAGCIITGRMASTGGAVSITTSTVTAPATASQVALGSFSSFAMFTNSGGVGATGACTVTGDIGTNAGAITGFETSTVNGSYYTSASISSVLTFSIYNNGVLVPNSSRASILSQSSSASNISLDAVVTTLAGQNVDVRVKVDSGNMNTGNRTFTTVRLG